MTAAPATTGRFITVEGGEGAGKSTQIDRLATSLGSARIPVLVTREPGGCPGAEEIRTLLVRGATDRWDPVTEALLHFAARREHLLHAVWPALKKGTWVISDRFADSTMAYQGYGHRLGRQSIATLYDLVVGDFRPDLTIILDLPVELGLARSGRRLSADESPEDRYERMNDSFHRRVRDGFLEIAKREPERCALVDASLDPDRVFADIIGVVGTRLGVDFGHG